MVPSGAGGTFGSAGGRIDRPAPAMDKQRPCGVCRAITTVVLAEGAVKWFTHIGLRSVTPSEGFCDGV